jgi:hypothetical protein
MASIVISELHPAGFELFSDSEGYMRDLVDNEFDHLYGGGSPLIYAGVLALESSAACAGLAGAAVGGVIGWTVG